MSGTKVDFRPEDSPNSWEKGELVSEVREHGGLMTHSTADVKTPDGEIHHDVTIVPPKN